MPSHISWLQVNLIIEHLRDFRKYLLAIVIQICFRIE